MTAADIARGLGLKHVGHSWRGPCPVHGGSSFTLTEKAGVPLFYCWHGCDRETILNELRARGLWPEQPRPERAPMTPAEKRAWAVRRRRAEQLAGEAETWRVAMVDEYEAIKREAYEANRLDHVSMVAPLLEQVRGLRGADLAEAYLKARSERPGQVEALVAGRRRDEQIARRLCSWIVKAIGGKQNAGAGTAA